VSKVDTIKTRGRRRADAVAPNRWEPHLRKESPSWAPSGDQVITTRTAAAGPLNFVVWAPSDHHFTW